MVVDILVVAVVSAVLLRVLMLLTSTLALRIEYLLLCVAFFNRIIHFLYCTLALSCLMLLLRRWTPVAT